MSASLPPALTPDEWEPRSIIKLWDEFSVVFRSPSGTAYEVRVSERALYDALYEDDWKRATLQGGHRPSSEAEMKTAVLRLARRHLEQRGLTKIVDQPTSRP